MESTDNIFDLVASPVELAQPTAPSERRSFHSHGRTLSSIEQASASRQSRFSVHFPMQLPALSEYEGLGSDQDILTAAAGTSDSTFLTVLAAQERRVLELKEELQRAEADLQKLKSRWTKYEEGKKREEGRKTTKLQPLQTSLPVMGEEEDVSGSSAWLQREMDRRKALLQGQRSTNRRIFSGSRHTRTLSLLSPNVDASADLQPQRPALPLRKESLLDAVESTSSKSQHDAPPRNAQISADLPILDASINLLDKSIDHELLLRTGKKFATDFKDGLWTFWEDIRQATVGEEATQPSIPRRKSSTQTLRAPRKQGSKTSLRSSSRGSSVARKGDTARSSPLKPQSSIALPDLSDASFWTGPLNVAHEAVPDAPKTALPSRPKSPLRPSAVPEEDDAWDTWGDSPHRSRHSSSAASESNTAPSTISGTASPRTSMSTNADMNDSPNRDPIPWPSLSTLGPGALRRTASTLMREWEKSLTPSPGKEFTGNLDYIGLKTEAAGEGDRKQD